MVIIISNSDNKEKIYDDELDVVFEEDLKLILSDKEVIEFGIEKDILREKLLEYKENYPSRIIIRFGQVTNKFKNYLRGMKMYERNKERISFYLPEEKKKRWRRFIESKEQIPTLSKLMREAVEFYIENSHFSNDLDVEQNHLALKQHLTVIKGALDFLLKEYPEQLGDEVLNIIQDALDQAILIESKIRTIPDKTQDTENIDLFCVEDAPGTMKLLRRISKAKEITFKGATNGQIALEMLKKIKPKIIFMDIMLPNIDGFELCSSIKHNKNLKEIPVYYMTCLQEDKVKERMKDTKANGYILKPFEYDDIAKLIDEYIPPKTN
ncbi:MAG: response regulator [Candidatus Lokiarchaeota archaeon]|nr:response regulator [Candidatus Lokiarchaeota archaeon]